MQDAPALRLLPVVMLVIAALIVFKLAGHAVFDTAPGGAAQAQEAEKPDGETATAAAEEEPAPEPEPEPEQPQAEEAPEPKAPDVPREFTESEREVLQSLLARREQLDDREREIGLREKLLEAAERRVEERIAELKAIEARIEASFGKQEEERKAQLQSLVSMYENMKPKDAARIFDRLDMSVLIGVVQQMKTRKMAPILAKMDSAVAQRLTVELAKIAAEQATQ